MFLEVKPDGAKKPSPAPSQARKNSFAADRLQVRMFHVGHGECILITFPNKHAWLVDAGKGSGNATNETLAKEIVEFLVKNTLTLDAFIPTHPHSDHAKAFTTLLADPSSRLKNPLTIYRTKEPSWFHKKRKWLPPYHVAEASWGDVTIVHDELFTETPAPNVRALVFASSKGKAFYRSVFMQLRFHEARMLFTGDAYTSYEVDLRDGFGTDVFESDLLKITHHGSADGTDVNVLGDIKPGIAIASTGAGAKHRLEKVIRKRIEKRGTRVFETFQGANASPMDIVVETDGKKINNGGILYRVELVTPEFTL